MKPSDGQSAVFPTPGRVRIVAEVASGAVTVQGSDTEETVVDIKSRRGAILEVAHVQEVGGASTIMIRSKKRSGGEHDVRIRCPEGTEVDLTTGSADLVARGTVGSIAFRSGSGELAFDVVTGDVRVKIGSGDVLGRTVGGAFTMHGASGDVRVAEVAGDLVSKTASGDTDVGRVGGDATVTTISGDVRIGRLHAGVATVRAVSGDLQIGVAPGSRAFLDLSSTSGDARSDLSPVEGPGEAEALELHAATVSGDIRVRRAGS